MIESKAVVILGAGPAGLAVGYELARRGVDFQILERGPRPGRTFWHFPPHLTLGPCWLLNLLPGSRVPWTWLWRRATPGHFATYLAEYGHHNHLPLMTDTEVREVRPSDQGFQIATSRGDLTARVVINATGYFSNPFIPSYPGTPGTALWRHQADCPDVATARALLSRSAARVLVVGPPLAAASTLALFYRAGFQVSLSRRAPGPALTEADYSPLPWLLNKLGLSWDAIPGSEAARYLGTGQIETYPDIDRLEGDEVHFQDGRRSRFDLVLLATGYQPALNHLGSDPGALSGMESTRTPGLFFLGLDGLRSYRSRFLSGIVQDARAVADLVARRVQPI